MILQGMAAAFGTVAFALLFGVPNRFYVPCGIVGAVGWLYYYYLTGRGVSVEVSVFLATAAVVLLARFFAVMFECPATTFLISGIFPLVPGGGVYWTSYYLVMGHPQLAFTRGFDAVRCAFCIVLGIVVVLDIPNAVFHIVMPWDDWKNGR